MEKRVADCDLVMVRRLIVEGKVRATGSASTSAKVLGCDFDAMVAVVLALTPKDFYKSMTTYIDDAIWQDVYRPATKYGSVYLKLTVVDDVLIVFIQGALTMRCPICGGAELIHDTRDMPYAYKGEETTLPGIEGDFCPACGEVILDRANSMKMSDLAGEFHKQVNAAMIDPEYIVSVRKKLDLDQREAAQIFGGGVNAFSRYENGKTKPPLALIKLLKVLEKHPDLLAEVR